MITTRDIVHRLMPVKSTPRGYRLRRSGSLRSIPFGLGYDEINASNLVKVDLEGNIVGRSDYPINRAGFVIHSAVHTAREDVHCVIHTHTRVQHI